jgi:pilus assembly protein CpaB
LLLIALLAGLVSAILVFVTLAGSDSDGGNTSAPASASAVVVAKEDIAAGDEITSQMVEVKQVPDSLLVPGAFASTSPVVGEAARFPIAKGDQLTPAKVGAAPEGDGLSFVVPKGMRGVAIEVREVTAVGGLVRAGDRVDVYAMFSGGEDSPNSTYRVIQDVEVLSVAQLSLEAVPAGEEAGNTDTRLSGQLPEDQENTPSAATVTVAVEPAHVPLLVCVQEDSDVEKVWLALRAFGEAPPAAGEAVTVPPDCVLP